ncbi:MAG TPA: sigma-70 family RNA polymerase sigma factor [Chthoniobacterales bacterium]|nr:sigma-70 family RNA polymerase sigma factor [Chthoniobacterales bacterium]
MAQFPTAGRSDQGSDGRRAARSLERRNQDAADQELMRRVVAADEAAFSGLYRRFAPGLFSMVYEILGDAKEAEDVVQESFVQMWKKASTYDPARSGLFTWAVMISRNRALDRLRLRQRRGRTLEAAAAESAAAPHDHGEQADEMLDHAEERTRIRNALSRLPEAQRAAIDLAFFRGLTQSEISAKTGEPLGTIKARIRRGLVALRAFLERADD